MQDCGEDSVRIIRNGNNFDLEFTSRSTGKRIVMHVSGGMLPDPGKDLTEAEVVRLAQEIAQAFGARVI